MNNLCCALNPFVLCSVCSQELCSTCMNKSEHHIIWDSYWRCKIGKVDRLVLTKVKGKIVLAPR